MPRSGGVSGLGRESTGEAAGIWRFFLFFILFDLDKHSLPRLGHIFNYQSEVWY